MKKDILKNYNYFVLSVWIVIGLTFWIQLRQGVDDFPAFLIVCFFIILTSPLTFHLSGKLLPKAIQRKKMRLFAMQFTFISFLISFIIYGIFFLFHYWELKGFFPESQIFESNGDGLGNILGLIVSAILINFGFCGLRFHEENLKLQKILLESRLKILQAQITPHFMFNVLNHVHVLIKKEPELADSLLLQYTEILRYQLDNSNNKLTTIGKEVQFLKDFIAIEKFRWKNKVEVKTFWKVENTSLTIPPLLLITFIENAFKHVSRSSTQKGYVNITLKQGGGQLLFLIENSKNNESQIRQNSHGTGVENIKRRLDILLPNKHELKIKNAENYYCSKLIINT